MVLDHVPDRSGLLVERPAPLQAEPFRHRDLDRPDVVPVPDRLEEGVREAEVDQVLHGVLAEIMVDPEDPFFVEAAVENPAQPPGRREVASERFLDDDPRALVAAGVVEPPDDRAEERGRDREVEDRPFRVAQFLPERRVGGRVVVVAPDVAEKAGKFPEGVAVDDPVPLHALPSVFPEPIEVPPAPGDADHRDVEASAAGQPVERREDLLVRQVSGSPEEDERIGLLTAHPFPPRRNSIPDSSPPDIPRMFVTIQ